MTGRVVHVIAPHPDDESIGCGGAICLHGKRGDRVHVVFLTSGELGLEQLPREQAWHVREKEAQTAAEILGLEQVTFLRLPDWFMGDNVRKAAAALRPIIESERPQLVYVPHLNEWHPDHKAASAVVIAALQDSQIPAPTLLAYEIWTPLSEYDHVEDITTEMRRKLRAIRCYQSQLNQFRYDRAVRGLNRYRGALAAHCSYAEVFQRVLPEMAAPY